MDGKIRKTALEMHTLLLCRDAQFLGTTRSVLKQLGGTSAVLDESNKAPEILAAQKFDAVVVDWREIENLGEFLCSVRRSKLNQDCVLVAIVRDLLDLRQAFAAGVHFLIHKPASVVQIERCLRAAYNAAVARRRKHHREPVEIAASVATRTIPLANATILNLSEGGAGLRMNWQPGVAGARLSVGEQINLNFLLPGTNETFHGVGMVVWTDADGDAGVQFHFIPDSERLQLERWLTACVERSVAELRDKLTAVCA